MSSGPEDADAPLASAEPASSTTSDGEPHPTPGPATGARPAPPAPQFSFITTILIFLFILGILMLVEPSLRTQVAQGIGIGLGPAIGFGGHSSNTLLLTMLLAGVIEMVITALAANWATDWIKAAKVGKWSAAFRKVQMEALRSGKKDRIDALKPHQAQLTALSGEVSMAQLKGMAITWFLVIAIYTWVGLFLVSVGEYLTSTNTTVWVNMGGDSVNLLGPALHGLPIPLWFLVFSLYTIPSSIVLRRVLKHYTLRQRLLSLPPPVVPGASGGAA